MKLKPRTSDSTASFFKDAVSVAVAARSRLPRDRPPDSTNQPITDHRPGERRPPGASAQEPARRGCADRPCVGTASQPSPGLQSPGEGPVRARTHRQVRRTLGRRCAVPRAKAAGCTASPRTEAPSRTQAQARRARVRGPVTTRKVRLPQRTPGAAPPPPAGARRDLGLLSKPHIWLGGKWRCCHRTLFPETKVLKRPPPQPRPPPAREGSWLLCGLWQNSCFTGTFPESGFRQANHRHVAVTVSNNPNLRARLEP